MKSLNDLKKDLSDYINKYNDKKDKREILECNAGIYKQILDILYCDYEEIYDNSLLLDVCLDTLFGDKYNRVSQLVYSMHINKDKEGNDFKKLKEEFAKLRTEIYRLSLENGEKFNDINEELELLKEDVDYAKMVVNYLKHNLVIGKKYLYSLPVLLEELGYDKTEIAIMVEKIFNRNGELYNRNRHKIGKKEKYRIVDLLSFGSEKFDYPLVKNPEGKINVANSILGILEKYDKDIDMDNYYAFLPVLDGNEYSLEDFRYIFYKVLEKLRDKLNEQVELFKDDDFMMDLEIKKDIRNDCNSLIRQYNLIRDYMDSEIKRYYETKYGEKDTEEVVPSEKGVVNKLKYLVSKAGNPYILSDFKDIDYEYIEEVLKLIMDFKYGEIGPDKFRSVVSFDKIYELKLPTNQIRVVMEKLDNNEYLVCGAFIKKVDNGRKKYERIVKRVGTVSEDPELIEEQLTEYVNKNKRKWTR